MAQTGENALLRQLPKLVRYNSPAMADKDTDQERERLRRVYADKTEGELRALAGDAVSLTPEAVQALGVEIARRKLDIVLSKSAAEEVDGPSDELVTIRTFRDL